MGPTKKTNKMHVQHKKKIIFFKHVALSEHFYSIFPGGWYVSQNSFLPLICVFWTAEYEWWKF